MHMLWMLLAGSIKGSGGSSAKRGGRWGFIKGLFGGRQ